MFLRPPALAAVPLSLVASLAAATAAAWALTLHYALAMRAPPMSAIGGGLTAGGIGGMAMSGMASASPSLSALLVFLGVWTLMMAAMMLPAITPMVLIFASAQARRHKQVAIPTWIFIAGYILVWAAAGLIVYVAMQIVAALAERSTWERSACAPVALGLTLIVAGLYQLTPAKRVCLRHCRSPFAFVAQYWREGRGGALSMGIRHGLYCLGCCWALFAVLIAAGMMSLAWMLLLMLFVFVEKVLPRGQRVAALIGAVLVGSGAVLAASALDALSSGLHGG